MRNAALTVTQLNEYVRRTLASDPMLRGVYVTGEISNFKRHFSGHWYFTLKDEEAAINCAMFRQSAVSVRFNPENGQRVRVFGSIGLYAKTGSYQLYAEVMEPDGVGDLYLQLEALKQKLAAEGLFDPSLKKTIPFLPKGIGIVTSKTGAVVHDICRVTWRRFSGMPVYLCPVKVQGEGAAKEIAHALMLLDAMPEVDVIIVGRGGGSMEDLWAFNEESVARAIALCQTPVISAVGHETDFTIADFVADLRAATPSAAAELAVPEKEALYGSVGLMDKKLQMAFAKAINQKRLVLGHLKSRLADTSPVQKQERMKNSLETLCLRMASVTAHRINAHRMKLDRAVEKLDSATVSVLMGDRNRLEHALVRLRAYGPLETMRRGYTVVMRNGQLIRSVHELSSGDRITLRMADGIASAVVEDDHQNE